MSGFKFLSSLRQGLAAKATGGAVALNVTIDASGTRTPTPVAVSVYGPGDVAGIDRRMIGRREPAPRSIGFAPNFLASIEFRRPDFPWMLSRTCRTATLFDTGLSNRTVTTTR